MNITPKSSYKIRFSDCDMFGHLNNSRYLDYIINAREDHLIENYNFDFNHYYKNDLAWVIGSHEITYTKPAIYNEIVTIQSTLLRVEDDLLHVEAVMYNENQTQIKAIMRTKLIPVNIKTGRKEKHLSEFVDWAKTLVNTSISEEVSLVERVKQILIERSK